MLNGKKASIRKGILSFLSLIMMLFVWNMSSSIAKDDWPTKQIDLVNPFGAGGAADVQARKLAEILRIAEPRSLFVVHMEVPCCSGLTRIAQHALGAAERDAPLTDVTVGIGGEVISSAEVAPMMARP
jgi:hypothetical protein